MNTLTAPLYQNLNGVALITLDNPPVNALSFVLRLHLRRAMLGALQDEAIRAIVLTGAGRGFCAGGDISEFDSPSLAQIPLLDLFSLIEDSPKPTVAALHGTALGGGLELAMACHARVAHVQTLVGLPEVHLGLVPGAGGTQRLPRLVGLETALNLVLQGRPTPAQVLSESGLFNSVTADQPLETAVSLARQLADEAAAGSPIPRTGNRPIEMENAQAYLAYARATVAARSRGLVAPQACVDCLESAVTLPLKEGLKYEFETFWKLRETPQSFGLRHAFKAERKASQLAGEAGKSTPKKIQQAVVVGAGTMGSGIAITLANAGLHVTLIEREQAALERGLTTVRTHYEGALKKGRLTQAQVDQHLGLFKGAVNYEVVRDADIVIEAVFEDLHVKRAVFAQLDELAKPGTLLASNTSMLDLNVIAGYTRRPQDVIGLHFFSPAQVMPLLEVVEGAQTSPHTLATAMAFARQIKKTAVVSKVCEGFIGNRMMQPYLTQAGFLLDEGALPHQVDSAIEKWGMAMGPFRVCDLAGNDLGTQIREQRLARDPSLIFSRTPEVITQMGRYGQKVGRGWYDYVPGQRVPQPSQEVNDAVVAESARLGIKRRVISDEEIVDRLLLALVNEGAKILEEGVAQRASDIDVVYVAGYGFPRWRGGPMFAADQRGLAAVLSDLERFAKGPAYQHNTETWRPAQLLSNLAEQGHSFSTFNESEAS